MESSTSVLNAEMLRRSQDRMHVRDLWKIGEPFAADSVRAVEFKLGSDASLGFPAMAKSRDPWTQESLTATIATAVIKSLNELGLVSGNFERKIGNLSGGYVRVFLRGATEQENEVFSIAMRQVLGPLDRPRYVIPRNITRYQERWFSQLLPEVIGKYFRKSLTEFAMLHAVPDALAKKKADAEIFQSYWNEFVSPGEVVFALRGEGLEMLEKAKVDDANADPIVHEKEVFL